MEVFDQELNVAKIPQEVMEMIFKYLSPADANNVKLVNSQCKSVVDSFQQKTIQIDDRRSSPIIRQFGIRFQNCQINHWIQPTVLPSRTIIAFPHYIRTLDIKRISESNLRTVMQECGKYLKKFRIRMPVETTVTVPPGLNSFLIEIPFACFWERLIDMEFSSDEKTLLELEEMMKRRAYGDVERVMLSLDTWPNSMYIIEKQQCKLYINFTMPASKDNNNNYVLRPRNWTRSYMIMKLERKKTTRNPRWDQLAITHRQSIPIGHEEI